jgi:hypothetical protein
VCTLGVVFEHRHHRRGCLVVALTLTLAACHASTGGTHERVPASRYVFLWAGDADRRESDFLAVVDADPRGAGYGSVVATLPVGAVGTRPHHTEYTMPAGGFLWANGFDASRTFVFDLRQPMRPALAAAFGDPAPYGHPHSYARLPNGHVLATFQWETIGDRHETGALVELDAAGRPVRTARAAAAVDRGIRPYSLAVLPAIDRVVTTASDMHLQARSSAIQVWRLSDLTLLQTILLPPGRRGDEQWLTAEPRVLADGRTVLVNTFTCGLYRVDGLDGPSASARWVYSSAWAGEFAGKNFCAVPDVVGRFWIQPSGPEHAVISLDVSDPDHPREVSRLVLGDTDAPHWIAAEPDGDRLIVTGYGGLESRALMARIDRATGALRLDAAFTTPGAVRAGVDLGRDVWPHGATGRAIPHGAVFSRP